jgi:hypothetical protein
MKKLLFLFALVPFLVNAQTPAALVDLSEYHDDNRLMEMVDNNFTDITDGTYTIPSMTADYILVEDMLIGDDLTVTGPLNAGSGISFTATVTEYTTIVTIDSTKIVGTSAGDIGHADGAILVASPGSGQTHEFVSAFIIYDHATADFAGGGDDAVFQTGVNSAQVTVSSAITAASLLTASADKILRLGSIATELVHADNGAISLQGTAYTNDAGTAAGLLRVHVTYRVHTTGL